MCLAALLVLLGTAAHAYVASGAPLLPSDTYLLQNGPADTVVVARSVWLGGNVRSNSTARLPTAEACIEACREEAGSGSCDWVNYCPLQARPPAGGSTAAAALADSSCRSRGTITSCAQLFLLPARLLPQGGCNDGTGPLGYQECRFLSGRAPDGSCTLSPPVVGRLPGPQQNTAGEAAAGVAEAGGSPGQPAALQPAV